MKGFNLETLKTVATTNIGRGLLKLKMHSPEILLVVGIGGAVTSTILACKATLKADEVIQTAKDKIDKIHQAKDLPDYSKEDYQKDMTIAYVQTGVDFVKLYGPALTLGAASIACILGAHGIMKGRNVALAAAYKTVEQGFAKYRKRVVEEFGSDKDYMFKNGIREEEVEAEEPDAKGKMKKVKKTVLKSNPLETSMYAKWFDESNPNWSKTPEYSLMFIKTVQNYVNELLRSRGHVFLNDVYDELGIDRTQAGSVVGWIISKDGNNFIDFGIYDPDKENARSFVNGQERSVLLDFNVDGVIYDLI